MPGQARRSGVSFLAGNRFQLDRRTEGEWVAADEAAAAEVDDQAVVTVPKTLLPAVCRLLAWYAPLPDRRGRVARPTTRPRSPPVKG
jgi:hypothetical protein